MLELIQPNQGINTHAYMVVRMSFGFLYIFFKIDFSIGFDPFIFKNGL